MIEHAQQIMQENENLKAELTKAREFLQDARSSVMFHHDSLVGQLKVANDKGAYHSRIAQLRELNSSAKGFLKSNQSAPADKGQREPVVDALSTGFYVTETGGGKYAINIGFRSMADMQAADQQLRDLLRFRRAEQPALVAVDEGVEFEKWWMSTEILRKGKLQVAQEAWEARARLNQVPKP